MSVKRNPAGGHVLERIDIQRMTRQRWLACGAALVAYALSLYMTAASTNTAIGILAAILATGAAAALFVALWVNLDSKDAGDG